MQASCCREYIRVSPRGLKFRKHYFPTINRLVNFFKSQKLPMQNTSSVNERKRDQDRDRGRDRERDKTKERQRTYIDDNSRNRDKYRSR